MAHTTHQYIVHLQCRVALKPYADVDIGVLVVYADVDIDADVDIEVVGSKIMYLPHKN